MLSNDEYAVAKEMQVALQGVVWMLSPPPKQAACHLLSSNYTSRSPAWVWRSWVIG